MHPNRSISIMKNTHKLLTLLIAGLLFSGTASAQTFAPSTLPLTNSKYYLGTTTPSTNAWKGVITDQLCLTGDVCRTTWPSSSGSSAVATSSSETSGRIPFWTSTAATPATLSGGIAGFVFDSSLVKLTVTNASTTNLSIGSLSGLLKQAGGVVVAAISGTDYEVPLTFSTGLTRNTNTVTVNTSQNITKLSNLTSNGFVKTSGGDGTLSVDTTSYLSSIGSGTSGHVAYWTGTNTLAGTATSSLSAGTGISISNASTAFVLGSQPSFSIDQSFSPTWTGAHVFDNITRSTTTAATTTSLFSTTASSTNLFSSAVNFGTSVLSIASNALTGTGTWNLASAVFRLPYSAAPTVSTNGDVGVDSTSNQFKYQSGGATKVLGNGNQYPAFTYATSTAWTGTTTIPLGPSYIAETWNGVQCFTDTGTLNVSFNDSTNRMDMLNASTTVGTFSLTTNNTFTAGEKRYVDIGTPASSPTKISCTVSKSYTAD